MKALATLPILIALLLAACGTTRPETQEDRDALAMDVTAAIASFRKNDPGLKGWFGEAHGLIRSLP